MAAISLLGTDYVTISAWWAAEKDNDYAGAGPILEIPAGVVDTFTGNFQFRYGTASKYTIRAEAGSEFVGDASNEAVIAVIDANFNSFDFRNNNVEFQNVVIKNLQVYSSGDTYDNLKFTNSLVTGSLQFVNSAVTIFGENSIFLCISGVNAAPSFASALYIRNSIAFNGDNCTIIDASSPHVAGAFKNRSTAVQVLSNSVVIGVNTVAYLELDAPPEPTVTNCAASDNSLPNAVITNLTTTIFEDFAAGDYRIKYDSAPALLPVQAGAFIVEEVNVAPVLDTPQSDVTIQEGQTGTITPDFSDANLRDTLTYSISPDINLVTGFTFNTSTGSIAYDGDQVIASAISYTITCSDGNGGTNATDTFDITVIPPQLLINSVSNLTPTTGETVTFEISNREGAVSAHIEQPAGNVALTVTRDENGEVDVIIPDLSSLGDGTTNYGVSLHIHLNDGSTDSTYITPFTISNSASTYLAEITTVDGAYLNDTTGETILVGDTGYFYNVSGEAYIDPATGIVLFNLGGGSGNYKVFNGVWSNEGTFSASSEDTVKPVISLIGPNPIELELGNPYVEYGANWFDVVDGSGQATADSSSVNINELGSYTVTYNKTDVAGNVADQVTRIVNVVPVVVVDTEAPVVTLQGPATISLELGTAYLEYGATWTDDTDGSGIATIGGDHVNSLILGTYTITYSYTDAGGNVAVPVTRTVTVTPKTAVASTFTIDSSNPVVDSAGDNVTYTFPIWELWDKIPEDETAIKVDSGVNFSVSNGVGSVQASSAQLATTYIFIARDAGSTPNNYIRTIGQVT